MLWDREIVAEVVSEVEPDEVLDTLRVPDDEAVIDNEVDRKSDCVEDCVLDVDADIDTVPLADEEFVKEEESLPLKEWVDESDDEAVVDWEADAEMDALLTPLALRESELEVLIVLLCDELVDAEFEAVPVPVTDWLAVLLEVLVAVSDVLALVEPEDEADEDFVVRSVLEPDVDKEAVKLALPLVVAELLADAVIDFDVVAVDDDDSDVDVVDDSDALEEPLDDIVLELLLVSVVDNELLKDAECVRELLFEMVLLSTAEKVSDAVRDSDDVVLLDLLKDVDNVTECELVWLLEYDRLVECDSDLDKLPVAVLDPESVIDVDWERVMDDELV